MATDPTEIDIADPYAPIKFEGYVKSMRTNERDGEMILMIALTPEWKFHGLLTTDHPGTMFDIEFRRHKHEPDEDTDSESP